MFFHVIEICQHSKKWFCRRFEGDGGSFTSQCLFSDSDVLRDRYWKHIFSEKTNFAGELVVANHVIQHMRLCSEFDAQIRWTLKSPSTFRNVTIIVSTGHCEPRGFTWNRNDIKGVVKKKHINDKVYRKLPKRSLDATWKPFKKIPQIVNNTLKLSYFK